MAETSAFVQWMGMKENELRQSKLRVENDRRPAPSQTHTKSGLIYISKGNLWRLPQVLSSGLSFSQLKGSDSDSSFEAFSLAARRNSFLVGRASDFPREWKTERQVRT